MTFGRIYIYTKLDYKLTQIMLNNLNLDVIAVVNDSEALIAKCPSFTVTALH